MKNRERQGDEQLARGLKYYGGINCARDIPAAADCFRRAARADKNLRGKCFYYLGLCFLSQGYKDLERSERSFKKAARSGDKDALRRLGLLYLNEGAYPRQSRAAAAFKKAALNGDAKSKFYYGLLLKAGRGVKRDREKAFALFCEGAAEGDDDCLTEKGRALLYGEGTAADLDKAESALLCAAKEGNLTALSLSGALLQVRAENDCKQKRAESAEDGRQGGGNNPAAAPEAYIRAAEGGNAEGLYRLALCYFEGAGVKKDIKKAAAFFEEAARKRHPAAMERTAYLYGRGEGVPLDYTKARDCYSAAYIAGADCRDKARLMAKYLRRAKSGYAEYYRKPLEYERQGFFIEDDVLLKYSGGADCRVPEGIKEIAGGAFSGKLNKVTLPSTLAKVAPTAFSSAEVNEFFAARDCLAVRVREGRLYDKKGVKLC